MTATLRGKTNTPGHGFRRVMPNWCECDLRISGPTAGVLGLVEFARGVERVFDFDKFIPYPPQFAGPDRIREEWERQPGPKDWSQRPKDGYDSGGYQWRCENWGTNWNACNPRYG